MWSRPKTVAPHSLTDKYLTRSAARSMREERSGLNCQRMRRKWKWNAITHPFHFTHSLASIQLSADMWMDATRLITFQSYFLAPPQLSSFSFYLFICDVGADAQKIYYGRLTAYKFLSFSLHFIYGRIECFLVFAGHIKWRKKNEPLSGSHCVTSLWLCASAHAAHGSRNLYFFFFKRLSGCQANQRPLSRSLRLAGQYLL